MKEVIESKERLAVSFNQRLFEMGLYLGDVHWFEVKYENASGHRVESENYSVDIFIDHGEFDTACHVGRVSLYSLALSDLLGFHKSHFHNSRRLFMDAVNVHDEGKLLAPGVKPLLRKTSFTTPDIEKMKGHVDYILDEGEKAQIIGLHHFWQKRNPYGAWNYQEALKNPRAVAFSKLLAIIDFYDSASTRINNKFGETSKLPDQSQVRGWLLDTYGDLKIDYHSDDSPNLNLSGKEVIESLFEAKIFGRENPLNPFPLPYSFVYRSNPFERVGVVLNCIEREVDLYKKIDLYEKIDHEEFLKTRNSLWNTTKRRLSRLIRT